MIYVTGRTIAFGTTDHMLILLKHAGPQIREAAKLTNEELGVHSSQFNGTSTRIFIAAFDAGWDARGKQVTAFDRPPISFVTDPLGNRDVNLEMLHITT